jgi:hypothetical protein
LLQTFTYIKIYLKKKLVYSLRQGAKFPVAIGEQIFYSGDRHLAFFIDLITVISYITTKPLVYLITVIGYITTKPPVYLITVISYIKTKPLVYFPFFKN